MATAIIKDGERCPHFHDIEVMVLSLTAECFRIDSECHLFSKLNNEYRKSFTNLISGRQYNDRKRQFFVKREQALKPMTEPLNSHADIFATGSMPLETCYTN